jgi:hypothetical protein
MVRLTHKVVLSAIFLWIPLVSAQAWQVTLAWNASSGPVAGYRVYYGAASGHYTSNANAGNTTTYTATRLAEGVTYYFAVKAYDSAGNQSGFSNEVSACQRPFNDIPCGYWGWDAIEIILAADITSGCGNNNYCPRNPVTRAQMAVFLLRGIYGGAYVPPPATGMAFSDVPRGAFAGAWIEQLAAIGITSGCGGGNYCPNASVTRAQMAVFLLRAKYGAGYAPPSATGSRFADVPFGAFAADWIEQLTQEGITGGCGGGNYCPDAPVNRDQMAVFLVRAFNL